MSIKFCESILAVPELIHASGILHFCDAACPSDARRESTQRNSHTEPRHAITTLTTPDGMRLGYLRGYGNLCHSPDGPHLLWYIMSQSPARLCPSAARPPTADRELAPMPPPLDAISCCGSPHPASTPAHISRRRTCPFSPPCPIERTCKFSAARCAEE